MQESDVLLTFAELGIGLAGFSGVVVAFGYRGSFERVDIFRFTSAFAIAILVVVLSLVPVALSHIFANVALVWRLASLVAVLYFLIATPMFRRYALSIVDEIANSEIMDSRFVFWAGITFFSISLENLIGWPISPNFASYFLGLVLAFLVSAYSFATIVIYRPRKRDDA